MSSLTATVDRGLAIVAEIETLNKELKQIEANLEATALSSETVPLEDDAREGRQFLARGTTATVPVVIESDQIAGEFQEESQRHEMLLALCGDRLSHLYKRTVTYKRAPKDGKAFRLAAMEHWPAPMAACIIDTAISRDKHGIAKSRVIIAWDRATA